VLRQVRVDAGAAVDRNGPGRHEVDWSGLGIGRSWLPDRDGSLVLLGSTRAMREEALWRM
jgi:hypothetical protein